ncbi:MAG: maleate cis-trans isomerase family protein [Egibacteraceae bacterium]
MTAGRPDWKRVGLLIPSSNTVMEVDFYRHLPPPVTVHTARMFMESTTAQGENRMLDEFTVPAAVAVGTARPDVVVFGCTSAGALRGNAYDAELCQRIAESTQATAISVIRSVRDAIARRGGRRVGVITPYVDELNAKIRASIEHSGDVEVVDIVGLGLDENFTIAEVEPRAIVDFAVEQFGSQSIDLLFASCTNFRAVDALPGLEAALGVPVVTSNQATLEAVRRELAFSPTLAGQASTS